MIDRLKHWARTIKRDITVLWLAARRPDVPWLAKAVATATVAYALSPIDLIPDFVPVLGYLDDLIIVPLGILIAIRLIPPGILAELRHQAETAGRLPKSRAGLVAIIAIWLVAATALAFWLFGGR
jgi:uncharacterized membrane protein YkvA (DUF1232 family)